MRVGRYWSCLRQIFFLITLTLRQISYDTAYVWDLKKVTQMNLFQFSSVQSLSCFRLFATPWIAARQASLSITNSQSPLKLTSIESVTPSSHLILGHPLLLLPPIPPRIRVFSNESTLCMRWTKYWNFSFSIIPSKEIPGLIFRMDWLDLLAVEGTLKSLLQYHSSKASILWCSVCFPGGSEGKTPALNVGELDLIPGLGSSPGEGNGNPLQYPCLENHMDGRAWWATVHGVAKSQTRLSEFTSLHFTSLQLSSQSNSHIHTWPLEKP